MTKKARVAIIGRANVGKSTLFNKLTAGPKALVSNVAGTTRDRKEGECYWQGKSFTLIDTGGLDIDATNTIEQKTAEQAQRAIEVADLILWVVDSKTGITPQDRALAETMRPLAKKILLVANKVDSQKNLVGVTEFYQLGAGTPWPVSAATGSGTGDLLDEVAKRIKLTRLPEVKAIKIAIIGKPNVGKSSLVNALLGEERSIVNDEPYTTRDANEIHLNYEGTPLVIVDTAGVRRKAKINPRSIESESVAQSLESIRKADVVIFVTEANKSLTAQDRQLAQLIHDSKAAVVIIGNKWDLIPGKTAETLKKFEEYYRKQMNFLVWAPLIFMSAIDRTKLTRLKQAVLAAYQEKFRRIDENALGKFLKSIIRHNKPTTGKGINRPYIYRIKQMDVNPPQFVVQIKEDTNLKYDYLNYTQRKLREKFGFEGAPIKIWIEKNRINHKASGDKKEKPRKRTKHTTTYI